MTVNVHLPSGYRICVDSNLGSGRRALSIPGRWGSTPLPQPPSLSAGAGSAGDGRAEKIG